MLAKPDACKGCNFYQDGWGFVPDERNPNAKVRITAQNPGQSEVAGSVFIRWHGHGENTGEIWEHGQKPAPLLGKSGHELNTKFLPLAGLKREDVECTNVLRCRWRNSNELPPLTYTNVQEAIKHCQRNHWREPEPGQTLVVLGGYALWALTGEYEGDEDDADHADDDLRASRSIDGWRGWLLDYKPVWTERYTPHSVFATFHPAYFYRSHWLRPIGKMDFAKLGRILRGTWPESFPPMLQGGPWLATSEFAFDTEYNPWTKELHRWSVAWRGDDTEPIVYVCEPNDKVIAEANAYNNNRVIIMQNAEADWPYITSIFGRLPETWHDTMLAHSLLYGTLRHSLDFMGSLYARHNRWKHLQQSDPLVYSGMDALATYDIWQQLQRELARDKASADLYEYELKPLLPHVMARPHVRLNAMHIANAAQELAKEQEEIARRGQAAAGWPLNVSSADQVSRWLRLKSDPQ